MTPDWPTITYEQARSAYEAGQKLYLGGRIYLVRPVLHQTGEAKSASQGEVFWVTDEHTLGDHGLLLFPDGRSEVK
jgi:hypothetical protein